MTAARRSSHGCVFLSLSRTLFYSVRLFFFSSSPGFLFFYVIPGLRPGDPYFKAQSPSQTPPEQRDPQGTLLSTCRAPAVQVIPWLDPGIQVNNKANLLTWIAGSSPAMTVSCTISRPAQLGALCEWLRFPLRMA